MCRFHSWNFCVSGRNGLSAWSVRWNIKPLFRRTSADFSQDFRGGLRSLLACVTGFAFALHSKDTSVYRSFNSASTSHDLQQRFQVQSDIRATKALLHVLVPIAVVRLVLTATNLFTDPLKEFLADRLLNVQKRFTFVSLQSIVALVISILKLQPKIRQRVLKKCPSQANCSRHGRK